MKKALWFALLCASACTPLTPPQLDGGAGGGDGIPSGGGIGNVGGGDGSTGGGSGVVGGGGSATGGGTTTGGGTGGGSATGGGSGGWSFGAVTINTFNTNSGEMVGLAENSAGLWALSSNSRLFLAIDGGVFDEKVRLMQLSTPFQPLRFHGDSTGRLFFVGTQWFGWCEAGAGCVDNANWNYEQTQVSTTVLSDACAAPGGKVVAIGTQGSGDDGVAYVFSNGVFPGNNSTSLGVSAPTRCWVSNSGDLLIAAAGEVCRYNGTQFTVETAAGVAWNGGASVPGHDWVFGPGPKYAEPPSWNAIDGGDEIDRIYAAVQASSSLTWGFGGSQASSPQVLWRFDGSAWSAMDPDLNGFRSVTSAIKASDGSIYFAGTDLDYKPAIGRGVPH